MNYIFQNNLNRIIRNSYIILFLLGSAYIGFSQCVLTSSDDTQAEVLDCLTACGCSTVQIPDGVTIAMNGDWDLTSAGDITLEILGSGSLEFSGNGGNAEGLILSENSVLVIGDPTNTNAIVQSGGNGQIRLTIGSTNFNGNDFAEIIEAGGADQNGPLPIDLLFFEIKSIDKVTAIKWATLNEISFSHFNIEWSRNGKTFNSLAIIQPQANKSSVKHYLYETMPLQNGIHYFRLKATDNDASFQYFPIKSVFINGNNEISIYPNPVKRGDNLHIKSTNEMEMIMISDISGQVVKTLKQSETALETSDLSPGIYLVTISNNGTQQVKRISIQ